MAARKSISVEDFEKNPKKELEFKCCKTKVSSYKFCLKCKKFWHNSCLAAGNKKIKVFSSTEIACCDITSNEEKKIADLTSSLAKSRESLQNLQTYCMGIEKQLKALQRENDDLKNRSASVPVSSEVNNNNDTLAVWKRLVDEMTDKHELLLEKNNFLQKELDNIKAQPPAVNCSFAQALSRPKVSNAPLVVNLKKRDDDETKTKIKNIISAKKSRLELVESRSGKIIVRGSKADDLDSIRKEIAENLATKADVKVETLRNPRIKVVGICFEFDRAQLLNDIVERNEILNPEDIRMVHAYTRNNKSTVILDVSPALYGQIMGRRFLYVRYQRCPVYDDHSISVCYRCCGFNHTSRKCENREFCAKCSGEHRTSECTSETQRCKNCSDSNEKFGTRRGTDHTANNPTHCESYKRALEKRKQMTNYPLNWSSTR